MDLIEQPSAAEALEREELATAYREVFSTVSGKRVLFDMLEMCAIYRSAFAGENNATNFTLGLQEAGKKLIGRLDAVDPRLYPQLLLAVADIRAMDREAAKRASEQGQTDELEE